MDRLDENLWTLRYPLRVLGSNHGRRTTIIRLADERLVIHSTAPFADHEVTEMKKLGEVGWLVEASLFHDTFSAEGRKRFPEVPFLAPAGFGKKVGFETLPVFPAPQAWGDELVVIPIRGAPALGEVAVVHRPSRTLIVGDLVFNFERHRHRWDRIFRRRLAGIHRQPGTSRAVRFLVRDREAFRGSMREIFAEDFDRLVPGHGEVIETGARRELAEALLEGGLLEAADLALGPAGGAFGAESAGHGFDPS